MTPAARLGPFRGSISMVELIFYVVIYDCSSAVKIQNDGILRFHLLYAQRQLLF